MATKSLFISHISEEAEVAALLKCILQKDFDGVVSCFASSDIGCIGAGENWLVAIERAMDRAKASRSREPPRPGSYRTDCATSGNSKTGCG
jgi:hypothetical protein